MKGDLKSAFGEIAFLAFSFPWVVWHAMRYPDTKGAPLGLSWQVWDM